MNSRAGFWAKGLANVLGLLMTTCGACMAQSVTISAHAAQSFVDSMGINVHLEYRVPNAYSYPNHPSINSRLAELGILHIRDEINNTSSSFVNEIQTLYRNYGITLCGTIEGGGDYPPAGTKLKASAVVSMIARLEPAIDAVEEPNEMDGNRKDLYNGVGFPQGTINESTDLWNIVKGNSAISYLPVVMFSFANASNATKISATSYMWPNAKYGNLHAYQGGGVCDNGWCKPGGADALTDWYFQFYQNVAANDIPWMTEMGYHNITKYQGADQTGVSPRASGIYLPEAYCQAINMGCRRAYAYELIDEHPDPGLTNTQQHYGILNNDGSPKPAYTALKNLISLMKEPRQRRYTPDSLTVTFTGAPSTMEYLLLQKSNGMHYLLLWNDVSVYQPSTDSSAGKDLYPSKVPVTLNFANNHTFTVYAPNDSSGVNLTTAYTLSTKSNSIKINLPAQLLILKIR